MGQLQSISRDGKIVNTSITTHERACLELRSTLSGLKDFQQATVQRITSLFNDPSHSHRILVADEVGLGKTIVAKGVIASLLLGWLEPRPFRVTYICSNLALATENRSKLAVFKDPSMAKLVREPSFSRLAEVALLPQPDLGDGALLEVCTLTPSTSFSMTYGAGNKRERLVIFAALLQHKEVAPLQSKLSDLFRDRVQDVEGWAYGLQEIQGRGLNTKIVEDFHHKLMEVAPGEARSNMEVLTKIARTGVNRESPEEYSLLRRLRVLFAGSCAAHLQADLFILDEFQRFESLLDQSEGNEHSMIAQQVFRKNRRSKIILLSATPFKALSTIPDDENDDGHLSKLEQILSFLNLTPLTTYEPVRKMLKSELQRLRQAGVKVDDLDERPRQQVESLLRPLIVRTERSQIAVDVNRLIDASPFDCSAELRTEDIKAYIELDRLGRLLEKDRNLSFSRQMMDFYKSAAWPLSFSTGYKLQDVLQSKFESDPEVRKWVKRSQSLWLPRDQVNDYKLNVARDAPNPRVRSLTSHLFGDGKKSGPEMLLWVPPSMPHYPLVGVFVGHETFSKTLLFSAWAMVPRMLSGLLSYESERRVLGRRQPEADYFPRKARSKARDESASHHELNRLIRLDAGDLAYWSLVYPSKVLIDIPLTRSDVSLKDLLAERIKHFAGLLKPLAAGHSGSRNQNHWYVLGPMLLDRMHNDNWYEDWIASISDRSDFHDNTLGRVDDISQRLDSIKELGEMPADLPEYLAWLSVGSPAICAYRALSLTYSEDDPTMSSGHASSIALAFVSLFNGVSGSAVIKRISKRQHWRGIVKYCAEGGLQAMLEEYFYMLSSSSGVDGAVKAIDNSLRTKPSSVKVWKAGPIDDSTHLRCHYAVQLGTQKASDEAGQERVVSIRESFNSPFRPFVLASTSIGQEGLDFHWYCSDVVHWNLPSNPIDLEQREGRVNRYQSLVVRRRVVQALSKETESSQRWATLFENAAKMPWKTDLVPYWHYPEGDAQIRRLVPVMAMSQEQQRYPQMLKILSLYRLAFGQPGQSELLEHLKSLNLCTDDLEKLKQRLMIQLAPILYKDESQDVPA